MPMKKNLSNKLQKRNSKGKEKDQYFKKPLSQDKRGLMIRQSVPSVASKSIQAGKKLMKKRKFFLLPPTIAE